MAAKKNTGKEKKPTSQAESKKSEIINYASHNFFKKKATDAADFLEIARLPKISVSK